MNSRNELIISRVRLRLKEFNQNALEQDEIFDLANEIQDEIFSNSSIKNEFRIILVPNQDKYDFAAQNSLDISRVSPSWNGSLQRVSNANWDKYKNYSGAIPVFYTLFGQHFIVAPKPQMTNGIVTIWGEQLKTINLMDETVQPEIPELFDAALTYGIIARVNPDFEAKYIQLLRTANERYNNKTVSLLTPECEW